LILNFIAAECDGSTLKTPLRSFARWRAGVRGLSLSSAGRLGSIPNAARENDLKSFSAVGPMDVGYHVDFGNQTPQG
jgi:hypothetical protein